MALSFPLSVWVGLASRGIEVVGPGYVREPATLELEADGITAANNANILWPMALGSWGAEIDTIIVFGDATGPDEYGRFTPTAPVSVGQYERVMIPYAALQCVTAKEATGFGTFTFGIGHFGTTFNALQPPGAGTIGSAYGQGPYGYGAYERVDQTVLLLKVFDPVALCGGEPADWAPHGPAL